MEQNSEAWHEWRGKGIGSSDIPIILGLSPWKTPLQLWEEKTGLVKSEFTGNYATDRGHALESVAREIYSVKTGLKPVPINLSHGEMHFMRASLDGLDMDTRTVLEIKCPGKEDHLLALTGKVPEKYMFQVQHQLFVAGSNLAHYWSFDGVEGVLVPVERDEERISRIKTQGAEFWRRIVSLDPPPMSDRDVKKIKDKDVAMLVQLWRSAKATKEQADELLEACRDKLLAAVPGHPRVECDGLKITTYFKKGNVQYSQVPALKDIDLEPYRSKPSKSTTFTDSTKEKSGKTQQQASV